jgi:transcriptional regulator with XRE-family HTH domain
MEDMKMYQQKKVDMRAFGRAVKEAREQRGLAREKLAEMLDLSTRHIQYIETRGQHPSVQKLYELAAFFSISIDQFFFPDNTGSKATPRRQLDAMLDGMDDKELHIVTGTAIAIQQAREMEE